MAAHRWASAPRPRADPGHEQGSLLGRALPDAQFGEHHAKVIAAPPEQVWQALHALRLRDLRVSLVLGAVRGIAERGHRRSLDQRLVDPPSPMAPVHEERPRLMVSALVGRPWKPTPERGPALTSLAALAAFDEPGWLTFGVEWVLTPLPGGRTYVETTTLCRATDEKSRRRFAAYWAVIGPFSALIRRDILAALDRAVRRQPTGRA